MDPLILGEWWWVAAGVGGVTAGVITMRRRSTSDRRLEIDAARHDLKAAQQKVVERKLAAKLARAELTRLSAERAAKRASSEQVASAKRLLRERENEARAAVADVRARQMRLTAARSAVSTASARPLDRLQSEHDAIVARWMAYETDPALQIAYPSMADVKRPATAAYLRAAAHAAETRRAATASMAPADYAAYRDAVAELERAFDVAEHAARVEAGEQPAGPAWQDAAQDVLSRSAEAVDRAAGAAASALNAWIERRRPGRGDDGR